MSTKSRAPRVDEETPLLRSNDSHDSLHKEIQETPLPWRQFLLVLFLQFAEPLTSQVIYPFIPQLIRDIGITHGNDKQVGYYAGLMQSLFFAAQAMTVLQWSRISDHVGRKPVLLVGLFGLSLSMFSFGLSKTFWGLVISRSLAGALNGNIGVIKSIMAEITDSTNVARAFAYQPIAWASGSTIGPLIGGALARPADRFPSVFGNIQFFKTYPYFLPCAVPATFSIIAWIVTLLFLEETNPRARSIKTLFKRNRPQMIIATQKSVAGATDPTAASLPPSRDPLTEDDSKPLPLRAVLTPRVIVAAGNYALLSLVDIAYAALRPLFFAMPVELGGLGLPPPTIGYIFATLGALNGLFQVLFFAAITKRFGSKRLYMIGSCAAFPIFALFPVMSLLAQTYGVGWIVWSVVGLQLALTMLLNVCYGTIFIYISAAAPNSRSIGATNGVAQMLVSITRTIGPAAVNSLFSLSLERGYLGGWLVYYVMLLFAAAATAGGAMLPQQVWKRAD